MSAEHHGHDDHGHDDHGGGGGGGGGGGDIGLPAGPHDIVTGGIKAISITGIGGLVLGVKNLFASIFRR